MNEFIEKSQNCVSGVWSGLGQVSGKSRNHEVRGLLFGITDDRVGRRCRSGQFTRLLRPFADLGLIHKIAKKHRCQLTA